VVIYGGGVHFSKDFILEGGQEVYGKLVADEGDGWGELVPDVVLHKLSQEHGILKAPDAWIARVRVGDVVKILPVHSCLTMDLMRHQAIAFV
jgi:D-serine deaminase-like pyridoxal phosphate-dependent protein